MQLRRFNASWTGSSEDYLEDVLVASQSKDLHLKDHDVVLDLLGQNGLVLKLEKCSFAQREIDYLGHRITPKRIVPLCGFVDALLLQPCHQDVRSLQRFLGMVNFYRSWKILEYDIFNPDWLINLEIKNLSGEKAVFIFEIKKKSGSSNNPDVYYSKDSALSWKLKKFGY